MHIKISLSFYFVLLINFTVIGNVSVIDTTANIQNVNNINNKASQKAGYTFFKKSIIPVSLIGAGLVVNNSVFEKKLNANLQESLNYGFSTTADDYLAFAPVAVMYVADIAGVKSKNHWFNQSKYLFFSLAISATVTYGVKYLYNKPRPDGTPYSFPSMHTGIAFTGATVLFNEFKQDCRLLAYSGFVFATATGVFRILNNRHYLSDVLAGAGIGIASVEIIYFFKPFEKINPFKNKTDISFIPVIIQNTPGLYFSMRF